MASQALLVVLAPTVVAVSREFGTTVGAAGQARAVTAVSAIATSLALAAVIDRLAVPALLRRGAALALAGCAAVAAAPALPAFLAAHVLVGVAFACLLSAGFAGVAAFPAGRAGWAMGHVAGANALAWIVVNPAAGVLTDALSWRVALVVPALVALAALLTAGRAAPTPCRDEPGLRLQAGLGTVMRDRPARRWLLAELAAYFAWAAQLTFVGAFFIEHHGVGETAAGVLLALGAAAYFASSEQAGALAGRFRRRHLVAASALVMAVLVPLQFTLAPSAAVTLALFAGAAVFAGIRTPASAALGLAQVPERPGAMMAARTAVTQLGYLLGAVAAGVLLTVSGYAALGAVLGAAMVASAALALGVRDPAETGVSPPRAPVPARPAS
jgi:predicted MFS family arabinose efflux permease